MTALFLNKRSTTRRKSPAYLVMMAQLCKELHRQPWWTYAE